MNRIIAVLAKFDWFMLGAAFVLVAFGLAAIYSVALGTKSGDLSFIEKQAIALVIGLILVFFLALSNYRMYRNWTLVLYIISIVLLVGVLFFGTTVRGTTGWFSVFSFSFQPVEFAKIVLILVLAKYFSEKARRQFGWYELFASGILTAIPAGLVMFQPDFGSASVLIGIWMIMIFFAGLRWRHALVLSVIATIASMFAWFIVFAEYQKKRILIFIDPSSDPLGRGYNVAQAIIAIGSGKLFGRGLGFGSQSQLKFLPESQTDFIFAVIAEELGFVGVVFIMAAFALLFLRLISLARHSRDDYTTYLVLGIGSLIFIQVVVNIGMNLGMFPVTGLGLPFVSYGGSSLITVLALVGILQSVAVRSSSKAS